MRPLRPPPLDPRLYLVCRKLVMFICTEDRILCKIMFSNVDLVWSWWTTESMDSSSLFVKHLDSILDSTFKKDIGFQFLRYLPFLHFCILRWGMQPVGSRLKQSEVLYIGSIKDILYCTGLSSTGQFSSGSLGVVDWKRLRTYGWWTYGIASVLAWAICCAEETGVTESFKHSFIYIQKFSAGLFGMQRLESSCCRRLKLLTVVPGDLIWIISTFAIRSSAFCHGVDLDYLLI